MVSPKGGKDERLYDLPDNVSVNFREPLFASLMQIAERILIQAELIQDSRVNIAEVPRALDCAQSDGVSCANHLAPFDAAPGQPHGKSQIVVVAAFAALRFGRAAELPSPDHERGIEQSAALHRVLLSSAPIG